MAPIYTDANTACDHNQLTMEIMKKMADKHDLVCLLHEKPFAGVNGSGKHDNWSPEHRHRQNLFKPGKTPPARTPSSCCSGGLCQGCGRVPGLLRATVAFPGNDHRLGAPEALRL